LTFKNFTKAFIEYSLYLCAKEYIDNKLFNAYRLHLGELKESTIYYLLLSSHRLAITPNPTVH